MAKLPYMRVYVNDLFGDTITLSDAEFGSYVAIFMAMWKAGGWLTLDQARKASRVAAGRWAKRWAALAGYFEAEADGRITMQRVRDDLNDVGKLDDRRSKGVSASAANGHLAADFVDPAETIKEVSAETTNSGPNSLKNNNPDIAASRALAQRHSAAPEGSDLTIVPFPLAQQAARKDDWPDGKPIELLIALARTVRHPHFDPTKDIDMKLHASASTYFARWQDHGCSWESDVVPRAFSRCAEATSRIASLKFFDGAIIDAQRNRTVPHQPRPGDRHDDKLTRKHDNMRRALNGARAAAQRERDAGGGGFGGD